MTDTFGNRGGGNEGPPSGGYGLGRPVSGMGKFLPGSYQTEVITVRHENYRALLLLADRHTGDVHSDWYESLPKELAPGDRVSVVVSYGPGYIVGKNGGRYQAVDAQTKEPIGSWVYNLQDIYEQTPGKPATTYVEVLEHGGRKHRPKIYIPPEGEGPGA